MSRALGHFFFLVSLFSLILLAQLIRDLTGSPVEWEERANLPSPGQSTTGRLNNGLVSRSSSPTDRELTPDSFAPDWSQWGPVGEPMPNTDRIYSPGEGDASMDDVRSFAVQYSEELADVRQIDHQATWSTAYKDYRRAAAVLLIAQIIGFTISYANHTVIPKEGTSLRFDELMLGFGYKPGTWKNKFGLFYKVHDFAIACEQAEQYEVEFTPEVERWRSMILKWQTVPNPGPNDEWWCGRKRGSQTCREELQKLIVSTKVPDVFYRFLLTEHRSSFQIKLNMAV